MDAIEDKYWELMTKSLSGNLDADEEKELDAWLAAHPDNENHLQELKEIWSKTEDYKAGFSSNKQKAWENISSTLELHGKEKPLVPVRSLSNLYKVAAVIILVLTIWMFQKFTTSPNWTEIATTDKAQEIQLPDGSKIWLSPKSSLRYIDNMLSEKERKIELKGVAFFEVAHDPQKPFVIHAQQTETRVLGTSFNVDAQAGNALVKVSVVTGRVQFKEDNDENKKIILEPGMVGVFKKTDRSLEKGVITNTNFLFWKNRKLEFSNTTLNEVVLELNDKYGVTFIIQNSRFANQRITTSFENQSISDVIKELEVLLDVRIFNSGTNYIIQ
jgi:ferric-dicitrate binding protein FerR (iron transport regulator)